MMQPTVCQGPVGLERCPYFALYLLLIQLTDMSPAIRCLCSMLGGGQVFTKNMNSKSRIRNLSFWLCIELYQCKSVVC